jgi:hypothetical protein
VRKIELSRKVWRAFIAEPGAKALPFMLEHADHIERLPEQLGPEETLVRLSLTDDVFLRPYNGRSGS